MTYRRLALVAASAGIAGCFAFRDDGALSTNSCGVIANARFAGGNADGWRASCVGTCVPDVSFDVVSDGDGGSAARLSWVGSADLATLEPGLYADKGSSAASVNAATECVEGASYVASARFTNLGSDGAAACAKIQLTAGADCGNDPHTMPGTARAACGSVQCGSAQWFKLSFQPCMPLATPGFFDVTDVCLTRSP
jgi:hypothetical protein